MFIEERHRHILSLIREKGRIEVSEISKAFNISEDSARRDLRLMEEKGLVKRTYGGAILPFKVGEFSRFQGRDEINPEFKRAIAQKAASLVKDGDTILLDSSSTIAGITPWLEQINGLTIVTNSIIIASNVMNSLRHCKLFMIGGLVDPERANTTSIESLKTLQNIKVDKAFIGPCSISSEFDLWSTTFDEAEIKKAMINSGGEVIILADSSKFEGRSLARIGSLKRDYQLITDQEIKEKKRLKLKELIEDGLIIVPEGVNNHECGA